MKVKLGYGLFFGLSCLAREAGQGSGSFMCTQQNKSGHLAEAAEGDQVPVSVSEVRWIYF